MRSDDWWDGIREPRRIEALRRSGLFETGPEDAFDRLTELAAAVTGAQRACITFVDASHFAYKSTVGVAEGASHIGRIEESFCRYVVGSSRPFVVDDARADSRSCDNPAIQLHGVAAWAGYPIEDASGWVLGTFCLVATEPYAWTDTDLQVLATLAKVASSEVALRRAKAVVASARTTAGKLLRLAETQFKSTNAPPAVSVPTPMLARARQLSDNLAQAFDPVAHNEGDPDLVA